MDLPPYVIKAQALIQALCTTSWKQANTAPNGHRYARHRPYTVPPLAQALVEQLGRHDEEAIQALLLNAQYLQQI